MGRPQESWCHDSPRRRERTGDRGGVGGGREGEARLAIRSGDSRHQTAFGTWCGGCITGWGRDLSRGEAGRKPPRVCARDGPQAHVWHLANRYPTRGIVAFTAHANLYPHTRP